MHLSGDVPNGDIARARLAALILARRQGQALYLLLGGLLCGVSADFGGLSSRLDLHRSDPQGAETSLILEQG